MGVVAPVTANPMPAHSRIQTAKAPGHWVLARLGKRVLRPGGLRATRALLDSLHITQNDRVVEFAPGMGITAEMILDKSPAAYTAVERDAPAATALQKVIERRGTVINASAQETGLPDGVATKLVGEAVLSMHPVQVKREIIAEASRLLAPAGLYGIHELVLRPDNAPEDVRRDLSRSIAQAIHHGVTPLSTREWYALLEEHGLVPERVIYVPFRLLNPARVIADEGIRGAAKFALNLLRNPQARQRVLQMRRTFSRHGKNLSAIVIIARKQADTGA
jgi:hypothetical protein